jgi:hypothetical protein
MNIAYKYAENIIIHGTIGRNMLKIMMWLGWLAVNVAAVIVGIRYWQWLLVG